MLRGVKNIGTSGYIKEYEEEEFFAYWDRMNLNKLSIYYGVPVSKWKTIDAILGALKKRNKIVNSYNLKLIRKFFRAYKEKKSK